MVPKDLIINQQKNICFYCIESVSVQMVLINNTYEHDYFFNKNGDHKRGINFQ